MSNKALVAIVGPSGSGKSTSLRNLPPDTTRILDLEMKGLPFRNVERFKIFPCPNIAVLDKHLTECLSDTSVQCIVIESFQKYIEILLRFAQTAYKGYDVWNFYNKSIGTFLDKLKNDHAVVVITALDEIVKIVEPDGSETAQRRLAVKGKEWEGKVEKEFLMVLYTTPRKDKDQKVNYLFQTNTDTVTSAKTPMGMFDDQYIPNDLNAVIERAKAYYNGDSTTSK